jgi:hypothetical protein
MLVLYVRVVVTFGDVFGSRRARQIDQGQTAPVVHASPLAVMVSWFTEVEARVRTAQNAEPRNLSSPPPQGNRVKKCVTNALSAESVVIL